MSVEKIEQLGSKLRGPWTRFRKHFRTKTRDTSEHALAYMQGQMTMEKDRHFAGIANSVESTDGQALQHFTPHLRWVQVCHNRRGRKMECTSKSNLRSAKHPNCKRMAC